MTLHRAMARCLALGVILALTTATQGRALVLLTYSYTAPHVTSGDGSVVANTPLITSLPNTLDASSLSYALTTNDGNPVTSDWSLQKTPLFGLQVPVDGPYVLTLTGSTDATLPAGPGTATFEIRAFTNNPAAPEIDIIDPLSASGPVSWNTTVNLSLAAGTYVFGEESTVVWTGPLGSTISFASDYTVTLSPALVTPEPATLGLAATAVPVALVGLFLRRKARRN